jgi:hypothetical protein
VIGIRADWLEPLDESRKGQVVVSASTYTISSTCIVFTGYPIASCTYLQRYYGLAGYVYTSLGKNET